MMVVTVDLASLVARLEQDNRGGYSAVPATFLIVLMLGDAIAALHGRGIVLPAIAGFLSLHDGEAWLAWLTAACHAALLLFAFRALGDAKLLVDSPPEFDVLRAVSGRAQLSPVATQWLIVAAPAFLLLALLMFSAPVQMSHTARPLAILAMFAGSIAMAGLLSRGLLALRLLEDADILIGVGAAVAAVMAAVIIIDPVASVAIEPGGGWIALLECSLICAVPLVLAVALMPRQLRIYQVTVADPENTPGVVPYNSFSWTSRSPAYLSFPASSGQIAVLMRGQGAPTYQLFDTTDSQARLHLHNCEIQIWNLTRLAAMLARDVAVTANSGNFEMTLSFGTLLISTKLDPQRRYEIGAVSAVNDVLFKNTNLTSLFDEAAGRLLDRELSRAGGEQDGLTTRLEEIKSYLTRKPTSASILQGVDLAANLRPVDLASARLEAARTACHRYLDGLQDRHEALLSIERTANQAIQAINDDFIGEIAADVSRSARARDGQRAVDTRRVAQLIDLVGVRIINPHVVLAGAAADCAAQIVAARQETDMLFEAAQKSHQEAVITLDDNIRQMERHVVRPGSLPRRVEQGIVGNLLGQQAPNGRPPPLPAAIQGSATHADQPAPENPNAEPGTPAQPGAAPPSHIDDTDADEEPLT